MKYKFKEKENDVQLKIKNDSIVQENSNHDNTEIYFKNIKHIRLFIDSLEKRRCVVTARNGEKIIVRNESFNLIGDNKILSDDYNRFLKALHEESAKHSQIGYTVGSPFLFFTTIIGISIVLIPYLILFTLSILYPAKLTIPVSTSIIAIIMAVLLYRTIRSGIDYYSPHKIPNKCLSANNEH